MPYIKEWERDELLSGKTPTNPGQLNFVISSLLKDYMEEHGLSYGTINDIVGVLECAKNEFHRVVVNPYEERKRQENGGLY